MPGGDRTGPMGSGPMTGRGAGFCSGTGQPGYASQGVGGGFRGGRGRGRRNRFFGVGVPVWARSWDPGPAGAATLNPEQEKQLLQQQVQQLQSSLDAIQNRINELDGSNT
jgi:hypothetical protein